MRLVRYILLFVIAGLAFLIWAGSFGVNQVGQWVLEQINRNQNHYRVIAESLKGNVWRGHLTFYNCQVVHRGEPKMELVAQNILLRFSLPHLIHKKNRQLDFLQAQQLTGLVRLQHVDVPFAFDNITLQSLNFDRLLLDVLLKTKANGNLLGGAIQANHHHEPNALQGQWMFSAIPIKSALTALRPSLSHLVKGGTANVVLTASWEKGEPLLDSDWWIKTDQLAMGAPSLLRAVEEIVRLPLDFVGDHLEKPLINQDLNVKFNLKLDKKSLDLQQIRFHDLERQFMEAFEKALL